MPEYEAEIDGKIYEIEAPNEGALRASIAKIRTQRPNAQASSQRTSENHIVPQQSQKETANMAMHGAGDAVAESNFFDSIPVVGASLNTIMGKLGSEGRGRVVSGVLGAGQGATLSFQDDIAGLVNPEMKDAINTANKFSRDANPGSHLIGEIAGGLNAGGRKIAEMGALKGGALIGGITGAGKSEGGFQERVKGGATGATLGAVSGYGVDRVLRGAGSAINKSISKKANAKTPSVKELKGKARKIYNKVDDNASVLVPSEGQRVVVNMLEKLRDPRVGFDPKIHKTAHAILKEVRDNKGALSVTKIRQLQQRAERVSGAGKFGGEDAHAAGIVRDVLDKALRSNPKMVPGAGQKAIDGNRIAQMLDEADAIWRNAKSAGAVEKAIAKGKRNTMKSGSGGNLDNNVRSALDSIRTGKQGKFLDDETNILIDNIVNGSKMKNAARLIGKSFDPTTGGLAGWVNTGAAFASGGATIPLNVAGFGSRKLAERTTIKEANALSRRLRARGLDVPVKELQEALIIRVMREHLASKGPAPLVGETSAAAGSPAVTTPIAEFDTQQYGRMAAR